MFQTINWLSTWIVESDAGTYSHRFHQELIQRLAVSHATTPTAHLFYSSFLPRFTLWPMGRREKNMEIHTQKHAKTKGQGSMPTMAPTYIKMKINKNVHNKVPKPRGNKTHKKSVSKLIATCDFGVSLGLGLKADRDVKAYVAHLLVVDDGKTTNGLKSRLARVAKFDASRNHERMTLDCSLLVVNWCQSIKWCRSTFD